MEPQKETGVLDDLTTPSVTKETPQLFSLKNYFKPTSKNILILGDILVALGGLIGTASIAALSTQFAIAGMVISGLGIILQRLTKEEQVSTINRAVEDIKIEEETVTIPQND